MKKIILSMVFFLLIAFSGFAQSESPQQTTATAGTLTISATISSGTYISAVWINSNTSNFLRTIYVYNNVKGYRNELTNWVSDSNRNLVNAVTGATTSSAGLIKYTWNGTDQTNSTQVADGDYTVRIEVKKEKVTNSLVSGTFTKGSSSVTISPSNNGYITNVSIKWEPTNTALENVEQEKMYSVYPNPALSDIYVSGIDIKGVDICSLSGKVLLNSRVQNVNVSSLPKGAYLAVIYTKSGTVVKKIEKL